MQSVRHCWSVAGQADAHATSAKQSALFEQEAFSAQQLAFMQVLHGAVANEIEPQFDPASDAAHSTAQSTLTQLMMKLS